MKSLVTNNIKHQREMKIELEEYDYTCADGCCYTTGYDVFVDSKKIVLDIDGCEASETSWLEPYCKTE